MSDNESNPHALLLETTTRLSPGSSAGNFFAVKNHVDCENRVEATAVYKEAAGRLLQRGRGPSTTRPTAIYNETERAVVDNETETAIYNETDRAVYYNETETAIYNTAEGRLPTREATCLLPTREATGLLPTREATGRRQQQQQQGRRLSTTTRPPAFDFDFNFNNKKTLTECLLLPTRKH